MSAPYTGVDHNEMEQEIIISCQSEHIEELRAGLTQAQYAAHTHQPGHTRGSWLECDNDQCRKMAALIRQVEL